MTYPVSRARRPMRNALGDWSFIGFTPEQAGATVKAATGEDPQVFEDRLDKKNHMLRVRIANGDRTAWLEALRSGDPDWSVIGAIYIRNNVQPIMSIYDQQFAEGLTPDEYKQIFGTDIRTEAWWINWRQNLGLNGVPLRQIAQDGTIYEGMVPEHPERFPAGRIIGNAYDLKQKLPIAPPSWQDVKPYLYNWPPEQIAAWAARFGWPYEAPAGTMPVELAPVQTQTTSANGVPSGWHQGSLPGQPGWWGPDGLFYAGESPWRTAKLGTGQSINTGDGVGDDGGDPAHPVLKNVPAPGNTDGGGLPSPGSHLTPVEDAGFSGLLPVLAIGGALLFFLKRKG